MSFLSGPSPLATPERLRALALIGLMDTTGDPEFDRVSALAARCVLAPISLVSLVSEDCQVFPGAVGLGPQVTSDRRTPISHSFCQHVVIHESPLVIADARSHALVSDNPAIQDLGVAAYLGFPITTSEGVVLGAFCVIDSKIREWTGAEIRLVRDFTAIVADQLENRMVRARSRNALDAIVHDLKTPLSGITMATALLQERVDDLPPNLRPLLEVLADSSTKSLELIKTLSNYGHLPSPPTDRTSCLSEVVSAQTDALNRLAKEKEIELEVTLMAGLPEVAAERWVIERIIANLVGNALKFSPFQSKVRISTCQHDYWVKLEISDQGPGFTDEDRSRLFQRYARLSAHPTGGEASTGIGLSIVKRLVDQAAGKISLVSKPGEGAVFEVLLPMVD